MQNQNIAVLVCLSFFAEHGMAMFIGTNANSSQLRSGAMVNPTQTSYGEDACPCVGIDNLKGYYSAQLDYYHVQYKAETGASCEAWDNGKHPDCRSSNPPQWCKQSWCYVDPCNCKLDVLPKMTKVGITYQGSPAYWSYKTCGGFDFYSQEMSPDACVMQKTEGECSKSDKCAWNGKQCGGKEAVTTCANAKELDKTIYGEEDCRCVGLGGRDTGKAFMHINQHDLIDYSANLGSTCHNWEGDSHPACKGDGEKPKWCSAKWCFVDPCKCTTARPPKTVSGANRAMRFQGKTAYWSYATCGSEDYTDMKDYCPGQKTEAACVAMPNDRCAWNGKGCLGKALVTICAKQRETGVLGMEAPLQGGAQGHTLLAAFIVMIFAH